MVEIITDHLDIWTSALLTKSTAGRGNNGKLEAYGIKKLRELILELAVRGKLVPQDPSDESISELLKKVATEKAGPIRAGKAKKERSPAEANDEEMRFALPKSWAWILIGGLAEILDSQRKPITKSDRNAGPYPYYGASGVVDYVAEYIFDEPLVLVGEDGAKWGRGDSTAFSISGKTWVNNHAHVLRPNRSCILDSYLVYFLTVTDLNKYITGMTVPKLNQARLLSIPVAVPPLAEQHRIVAKIDELMALCDQLEQQHTDSLAAHQTLIETLLGTLTGVESQQEFSAAWARIANHFHTLFTTESSIDQLKQTILQLAVMGKLAPQDPNDEPASVLLKRIAAEKTRLISEGKIRKPKPLPPVTEEEMQFDISDGWVWARFDDLALHSEAGWSPSCEPTPRQGNSWGVLKVSAVTWGKYDPNENKALPANLEPKPELEVMPGDFLISRANTAELVARAVVVPKGTPPRLMMSDKIIRFVFAPELNHEYLTLVNGSEPSRAYYARVAGGTSSSMKNVSREQIRNLVVALPPLAEQHRIVAKADELMALCDSLKALLADAQTIQVHLADAIVEQAVC